MSYRKDDLYIKTGLVLSYLALGVGGIFGLVQVLERIPGVDIVSAKHYYMGLTAHGVLMALVFTTFFILSAALYIVTRTLGVDTYTKLNAIAYSLAIIGVVMAAATILSGNANVLYTFYPPLYASPFFYLGAALLILGSWVFTANILLTVRKWRLQGNKEKRLPFGVFGVVAVLIIWILATVGVAAEVLLLLLPWSLGIVERVDPLLARNLFWYFGHPLVYFWLLPAYIVWYTAIPKILNVRLFSETLARAVFVLFIVFSVPVGYHHQFMDPGIADSWKYFHTITTYAVVLPSLMTAFTLTATMEMGARRNGGDGILKWVAKLPWRNPVFSAIAFSMMLFAIGGASGVVNAGYNLNYVVHNTAWVVGHFHTTVGAAVALTFMGFSYLLVPLVFKRALYSEKLATIQVHLWFTGVLIFSLSMMYLGVLGSPRRAYDLSYYSAYLAEVWRPYLITTALGGILMFVSGAIFIYNIFRTIISGAPVNQPETKPPVVAERRTLLDNFKLFTAIAIVLILVAYVMPTLQIVGLNSPGAPPTPP